MKRCNTIMDFVERFCSRSLDEINQFGLAFYSECGTVTIEDVTSSLPHGFGEVEQWRFGNDGEKSPRRVFVSPSHIATITWTDELRVAVSLCADAARYDALIKKSEMFYSIDSGRD